MIPAYLLQQSNSPLGMMVLPIVMFAGMYLLLILPMQRQKKQQKQMLDALKSGDAVVTNGGLVGTISSIDSERDVLVLSCRPSNTKLEVARSAVAGLINESK